MECKGDVDDDQSLSSMMEPPPTTKAIQASCNVEVRRSPGGKFVGRAQQLNCNLYPCSDVDDVAQA